MRALGIVYRASLVAFILGMVLTGHFLTLGVIVLLRYLAPWTFRRLRARTPRLPRTERRRRARRDRAVQDLVAGGAKFSRAYSAVARAERDGAYCLFTTAQQNLRR